MRWVTLSYLFFYRISDAIVKEIPLLSFSFLFLSLARVCSHIEKQLADCATQLCVLQVDGAKVRNKYWKKGNIRVNFNWMPTIRYQVDSLKVQRWEFKRISHGTSMAFTFYSLWECLWLAFYAVENEISLH